MKVRMIVPMAGPGVVRDPGQVIEVSDAEGARLVAKGFAEPAGRHSVQASARKRQVRTATAPTVETPED